MNGIYLTLDIVDIPGLSIGIFLPIVLIIGTITAAVVLIRHFINKKK